MGLQIERKLNSRFEFSLDGGDPISDNAPNLTTFGDLCHFKTKNGANIIKEQNITYADVTIIDTFGGTGSFTFANVQNMWTKLIELNFFEGVGSNGSGGSGVTRFDALLDTFTYFGNDGKVPVVDEAQLKLVATEFYNFDKFTQLSDVSIETLISGKVLSVGLVEGVPKIILSDPLTGQPSDQYVSAVGGFYYADLATQTTALAYTTGDLQITNDIDGDDTFLSQPPYGITSVWDESSNTFDFSQLSIGDEVFLETELLVTTSSIDQGSKIKLLLGEGTADEETLLLNDIFTKTAGTTTMVAKANFDIRNENWRITGAKLLFSSDASADIEVVGFHPYIIRKSVNIIDINDNTFKTFTVSQVASPTVDVTTNIGTVKIGYEGTGNKLTNILFDLNFSKYLVNLDALLSTKSVDLLIYNKTKKKLLSAQITSFTEPSTGYYNAVLNEYIDLGDVDVNDELDFNFSVTSPSTGNTPLTTKGDILTHDGTSEKRVPVGADGMVLVADSAEAYGIKWVLATSGASLTKDINQAAHGLAIGDGIRYNGTSWVKAQADLPANSAILGVVSAVADVDNFTIQYGGLLTVGSYTNGEDYFLSNTTAGAIITEPTYAIGEVRQYIGTGTPDGLLINIDIGQEFVTAGTIGTDFLLPKETADTGTEIFLTTSGGNLCNHGSANSNTSYTIGTGSVLNGYAKVLINVASEPTITGATKITGVTFSANTDMYMVVNYTGASRGVEFYFLEI